jgi:hypothetical protein
MANYSPSARDTWNWRRAGPADVAEIIEICHTYFDNEFKDIIIESDTRMHYQLHRAILDMTYGVNSGMITVAVEHETNRLLAWAWIERSKFLMYSNEEMAVAEFSHVRQELSMRVRMTLVAQTIEQWICWCEVNTIPVLCSTSIRADQSGFMKLHDQFGFVRKGSFAYRRIDI